VSDGESIAGSSSDAQCWRGAEAGTRAVDICFTLGAVRKWDDVTDLLSQAKATVTKLLSHASPGERLSVYALAADPEGDQLQAFGDSNLDETNDDEIERFCERVAGQTGGEFVLVVPELAPVEHLILAHYSGGTGVGGTSARVNRQPGQAPTLSEWQNAPGETRLQH
jgi:hypothetical protein